MFNYYISNKAHALSVPVLMIRIWYQWFVKR